MRLIWEQGGGGANVEFVHIESGYPSRFAVNDHVKAFRPSGLFKAAQVGSNLHITWPSGAPCNWKLQSTGALANPSSATVWTDVPGGSPQDVTIGPGSRFFRLARP